MDQGMPDLNQAVLDLNKKIDALTNQVAYLTEQAQIAERGRREGSELVETMMPVAKDVMQIATAQLEEVQDYVKPEDLLRLVKKLARHLPQLEMLLDQMDGVIDLIPSMSPIAKEGMVKLTDVLAQMENKGYFSFARGGLRLADNVVTSFSEEDINRLGDNIVLILNVVKDMTQPEIMTFVRNTLEVTEREIDKPVNTSLWAIMGQINDPAVRRGLALALRVLRVVGMQAEGNKI